MPLTQKPVSARRPASINHGPQFIAEGSDQDQVVTGPSAGPSPARSERAVSVTAPLSWSGTRHEYAQVPPQPNLNWPSSSNLSPCRITNCGANKGQTEGWNWNRVTTPVSLGPCSPDQTPVAPISLRELLTPKQSYFRVE